MTRHKDFKHLVRARMMKTREAYTAARAQILTSASKDAAPSVSGSMAAAMTPGFMRTEAILEASGVTEGTWRDTLKNPQALAMGWGGSETPCFVGRAVAALLADPNVARENGAIYMARALSTEYGFTDIDGRRPDYAVLDAAFEEAKKTFLAPMIEATRFAAVDWKLVAKTEV